MELKIEEYQLPQKIGFNFEELKQELAEKVSMYETMVYTDAQIKDAKADKANLNKLKKALNDERIRREREYMQPFNEFKTKINEIISIIDKPVGVIDKQVKAFDEKKRQDKMEAIKKLYEESEHPEWLELEQIFNERWLLAGTSMRQIQDSMEGWFNEIKQSLDTLSNLTDFAFEATEVYKSTLDINKALNEGKRLIEIQKRKEEQERLKKEAEERAKAESKAREELLEAHMPEPEPVQKVTTEPVEQSQWISFRALLTVPQAFELKRFFEENKIEFQPIKG